MTSDVPRARFTADEVVKLTIEFYKRNYIEGCFSASGIIQTPTTRWSRWCKWRWIAPAGPSVQRIHSSQNGAGVEKGAAGPGRAVCGSTQCRNIELPTEADLTKLAAGKKDGGHVDDNDDLAERISNAKEEKGKSPKATTFAPAGQKPQMIVGGDDTTDESVLQTSVTVVRPLSPQAGLLFSLQPHSGAEHYAADSARRRYSGRTGFTRPTGCCDFTASTSSEIASGGENGMLDLEIDPKLAWALKESGALPGRREQGGS